MSPRTPSTLRLLPVRLGRNRAGSVHTPASGVGVSARSEVLYCDHHALASSSGFLNQLSRLVRRRLANEMNRDPCAGQTVDLTSTRLHRAANQRRSSPYSSASSARELRRLPHHSA